MLCAPRQLTLLCLVIVACLSPLTNARVSADQVVRDDRQYILLDKPFGFSKTGHLELTISNFAYWQSTDVPVDLSKIGFFLTSYQDEAELELQVEQRICALNAEGAVKLLTFDTVQQDASEGKHTLYSAALDNVITDFQGGLFSLFYVNCQKPAVVSFDIQVGMYNMREKTKDYLSVGEDALPTVYLVFFLLFMMAAAVWLAVVWRARENAHRIHWLMLTLAVFKSVTLLTQAGMYHLVRATGHSSGWNIAFYVFTFCRGLLFFVVVILVGTGWSYMKPLLAEKEKRILMVVIPLQVCAEVAIIMTDEYTPASVTWVTWTDLLHIIDIICCCAVMFPIVWSIKHLREASETDGKAAKSLAKLTLFRQFYVVVVSYIYFTRIVVYLLHATMPYKYVWLSDAAGELATLLFYVLTGLKFRPFKQNPYLALAQETDEQETV